MSHLRVSVMRLFGIFLSLLVCLSLSTAGLNAAEATKPVDFGSQIRPLLSDNCFACHGPDEAHREGGFRFNSKESAFGTGDSGETVITAGDPDHSEMFQRIISDDDVLRMPPSEGHAALKADEIALIKRWIEEGANWEEHWAFTPVKPTEPPAVANENWVQTPIDQFVLARLKEENLTPNSPAEKSKLLRRVTLDLTGLPPTIEELDRFLADQSPDAYEKVVDRLLASPRYGQHMARFWLDAARYGDTHGLHLDNYREMWPYRDWVVNAFNQNMPYDQFVIEQLAGDLLENPTRDQLIATGFNRCHVTTSEGGSIAEEVYTRNVVDRVVTFGTVFLGATFDCTRCHDHKFDPYTQADFYSMFAFFNSIDGNPLDGNKEDPAPVIAVPSAAQEKLLAEYDAELAQFTKQRTAMAPRLDELQAAWEKSLADQPSSSADSDKQWQVLIPVEYSSQGGAKLTVQDDHSLLASGPNPAKEVYTVIAELPDDATFQTVRLEGLIDPSLSKGGAGRSSNSNVVLTEFEAYVATDAAAENWERVEFERSWADHEQPDGNFKIGNAVDGKSETGWAIAGHQKKENRTAQFVTKTTFGQGEQSRIKLVLKHESIYANHQFGRIRLSIHPEATIPSGLPAEITKILAVASDKRNKKQADQLQNYFLDNVAGDDEYNAWKKERDATKKFRDDLNKEIPTTLVFKEKAEPKPAFILNRGEYDQPKDEVPRATPAVLNPFSPEWPKNRLGLAKWVVDPANPLTARVAVNRFWQQLFGVGLVKTSEDFGLQGAPASHPQLLDWLAQDFIDSGWDIQRQIKQMVMSATYRQSTAATPQQYRSDRENRLLARGPRFRLDAESLRDQALFVSGLLVEKQGGPSVKPPQPDGLWHAVAYSGSNTARFKADQGADKVHRRTLYTFLKRTAPAPQMGTFDSPSRESSCVRRERTNTPMQALLLFNDPQYLEAAQGLALRGLREGGSEPSQIMRFLYRLCTSEQPTETELEALVAGWQRDYDLYAAQPELASNLIDACKLVDKPGLQEFPPEQVAAWTVTANILLSMDKTLNKN